MQRVWIKRSAVPALFVAAGAIYLFNRTPAAPPIPSLIEALGRNDLPTIRSIVTQDATAVKQIDADGNTALHIAAMGGFAETVDLLIQSGADVNVVNKAGWPPLAMALQAETNQASVMKKLLAAGASPKFALPDGRRLPAIAKQFHVRDPQIFTLLASTSSTGDFK